MAESYFVTTDMATCKSTTTQPEVLALLKMDVKHTRDENIVRINEGPDKVCMIPSSIHRIDKSLAHRSHLPNYVSRVEDGGRIDSVFCILHKSRMNNVCPDPGLILLQSHRFLRKIDHRRLRQSWVISLEVLEIAVVEQK
jgi:hypothetical protein